MVLAYLRESATPESSSGGAISWGFPKSLYTSWACVAREQQDDPILVLLNMSEEKSLFRGENFEPLSQKTWKVLASTHFVATENFPSLRVNLKPFEGLVLKSD